MRRAILLLALCAALASATPVFAQTNAGLPDVLRRSLENSRIPEGHGVAFTWRARMMWDMGGAMRPCGEAWFRFDPRALRNARFRDVHLEGDGQCQSAVVEEARRSMRHGRPDIELVETGSTTFQPIAVVRQSPDSVTYSVRIVANPNWNGMFGDEREPLSAERLREVLESNQEMHVEATFDLRSARLLEAVQSDDEVRVGVTVMRDVRSTTTFAPLTDTIAFPRQGVFTAQLRALLQRINFHIEKTYSDVQLVRLDTPAPVVANATGSNVRRHAERPTGRRRTRKIRAWPHGCTRAVREPHRPDPHESRPRRRSACGP